MKDQDDLLWKIVVLFITLPFICTLALWFPLWWYVAFFEIIFVLFCGNVLKLIQNAWKNIFELGKVNPKHQYYSNSQFNPHPKMIPQKDKITNFIFCPMCGVKSNMGNQFCSECGHKLDIALVENVL